MRIIVIAILLLAAHLSATAFVPTNAGKAWIGWPFAADTSPLLSVLGQPQTGLTSILAGIAVLSFLAAVLGLFGKVVPPGWWVPLVVVAAAASTLLFLGYLSPRSILPLALDAILLWGVLAQGWTLTGLRG